MIKDFHVPTKKTLLILALLAGLYGCGQKTPEEHIAAARQYQEKHQHKAAILELKTAVQQQPNHAEARLLLGRSLYASRESLAAEKELMKARELGAPADQIMPLYARVLLDTRKYSRIIEELKPIPTLSPGPLAALHAYRAHAYMALKQKEEAQKELAEGASRDPQHPEILVGKARLALLDQDRAQAHALVDAAIKRDNRLADALYLKASLLRGEGNEADALKLYQQIVANDPTEYQAHLAIAQLHLQANEVEKSEKAIRVAEQTAPKHLPVKFARALFELQRGNHKSANDSVVQVLRLVPDHLPSLLVHAVANYGLGAFEQSRKSAEKVIAQQPDNLLAVKILAGSLLKLGSFKDGLAVIEPWLKTNTPDLELYALAGELYLQAGDYDNAMRHLDRAMQINPNAPSILSRRAASHLARGDFEQAIGYFEQATKLSDQPGDADINQIMLLLGKKKYDQALLAIASFEKKLPANPVIHNLRAGALLGKHDRPAARKSLEQALAVKADFLPALINLARLDLSEGKLEDARKRFEAVLNKDKDNAQVMMALADLASLQKRQQEYVGWLEKASKADPRAIAPRAQLAQHYLRKKEAGTAVRIAREGVKAAPNDPSAIDLLGLMQLSAGDIDGAVATYLALSQKFPGVGHIQLRLGQAQFAAKRYLDARSSLTKALQLDAALHPAYDALIRLELADGKPAAALQVARRLQSNQPKSPIGFEREADLTLAQKQYPRAVKAYEQALARGAGAEGLIKLHRALVLAGDKAGAERRMSDWIKQNPNDVLVRTYAASIYTLTSRNKDAIAQYEQLQRLTPPNPANLNNLALLYMREKDSRALATAEQALKLAPDNPGIQDTLGWILVEQGQLQRGTELLRTALSKLPKTNSVRYHYAVALARAGNKAEARRELERVVASGSKFSELEAAREMLKGL